MTKFLLRTLYPNTGKLFNVNNNFSCVVYLINIFNVTSAFRENQDDVQAYYKLFRITYCVFDTCKKRLSGNVVGNLFGT